MSDINPGVRVPAVDPNVANQMSVDAGANSCNQTLISNPPNQLHVAIPISSGILATSSPIYPVISETCTLSPVLSDTSNSTLKIEDQPNEVREEDEIQLYGPRMVITQGALLP